MSKDWLSNNQQIIYEDFDEPSTVASQASMVNVNEGCAHPKPSKPESYTHRFLGGMRGFWATKQTEDWEDNRDLLVKTTLRELIIYLFFLVLLTIITFGMSNGLSYYFTNILSNMLVTSPLNGGSGSYAQAASVADFWNFVSGPLMSGLYWNQWYNNSTLPGPELNLIYFENKLVGVPRIRQIRVGNISCVVAPNFQNIITKCYDSYSPSTESTSTFGLGNSTAWTYSSESSLNGGASRGTLASYGGGGFYVDLNLTQADSLNTLQFLFANLWVDRGTRAVITDFTVYNANLNLFCVIKFVLEFPSTGGLIPNYELRTVKLIRYVTPMDYFVLACELMFLVFILYYIVEEIIEIRKHGIPYFRDVFNCLDVVVICLSLLTIGLNIYRTILVQGVLDNLLQQYGQYPNFDFISSWQLNFNYALSFTIFFSWVKLFKYVKFNAALSQMGTTLGTCGADLMGFGVMFFIVFLGFAQLGYMLFSSSCVDFRTFPDTILTLFRMVLMDFNFVELQNAHALLGPLYFLLYVFFVFFVLFNMFIAIISDTYSEVKEEGDDEEDEYQMGNFFKQRANFLLSKLNLRKERIIGLHDAIGMADTDGDDKINLEEWKTELRKRGFEDEEIEAVFKRYDIDGNQVLDKEERRKMQEELEGQQKALNSEIKKTEEKSKNASEIQNGGVQEVSLEDHHLLTARVDELESMINSAMAKLNSATKKLGYMEKGKVNQGETVGQISDTSSTNEYLTENDKRKKTDVGKGKKLGRKSNDDHQNRP